MKKLLKIGIPVVVAVMLMGIGGAAALSADSVWADGDAPVPAVDEDVLPGNGWNCPYFDEGTCPGNGPNGQCLQDCDGECDGNCHGYAGDGECPAAIDGTCPGSGRWSETSGGSFAGKGYCGRAGGGFGYSKRATEN